MKYEFKTKQGTNLSMADIRLWSGLRSVDFEKIYDGDSVLDEETGIKMTIKFFQDDSNMFKFGMFDDSGNLIQLGKHCLRFV